MSEPGNPDEPKHTCTGPCRKKQPPVGEISAGAALLGLALLAGCPTDIGGGGDQPLYGIPVDDDDSAEVDDDDSAFDDDDADQPLYGTPG